MLPPKDPKNSSEPIIAIVDKLTKSQVPYAVRKDRCQGIARTISCRIGRAFFAAATCLRKRSMRTKGKLLVFCTAERDVLAEEAIG